MFVDFLEHSLNKSHEDLFGLSIKTQTKIQYQVDFHTNDKALLQKCFTFFSRWAFIQKNYSSCAFFIENRFEMMLSGNIFTGIFPFHSFLLCLCCYIFFMRNEVIFFHFDLFGYALIKGYRNAWAVVLHEFHLNRNALLCFAMDSCRANKYSHGICRLFSFSSSFSWWCHQITSFNVRYHRLCEWILPVQLNHT